MASLPGSEFFLEVMSMQRALLDVHAGHVVVFFDLVAGDQPQRIRRAAERHHERHAAPRSMAGDGMSRRRVRDMETSP